MATHSITLAQKIPWTEEPVAGYCPWGHKESDTTERLHFHRKLKVDFIVIIVIALCEFFQEKTHRYADLHGRDQAIVIQRRGENTPSTREVEGDCMEKVPG